MPKRPDFQPFPNGDRWMVSIPPAMTATGKRVRKVFTTEAAAEKFAGKLRTAHNSGLRGSMISANLANEALEAAKILEPHGIGLLEAAKMIDAKIRAAGAAETFAERYDAAMAANEVRWSDRYRLDMEKLPRWVGKAFMGMQVGQIDTPISEAVLRKHGAVARSTLDARLRYVSAILNYEPRHIRESEICIMTDEECRQMVAACEKDSERWAVGLLLWAGIRPQPIYGEIARLDWSAVGRKEIYISPEVSKTNSDRYIPITPKLREMIKGHPKEGSVAPTDWDRIYKRIRAAVPSIKGKQDVMRHTFASHYLAAFGETKTKAAMGHTANSDTLFRHYRRAVTERDGKAFFR